MSASSTPPAASRHTIRPTSAVVFPEPAPASTKSVEPRSAAMRSRSAWSASDTHPRAWSIIGRTRWRLFRIDRRAIEKAEVRVHETGTSRRLLKALASRRADLVESTEPAVFMAAVPRLSRTHREEAGSHRAGQDVNGLDKSLTDAVIELDADRERPVLQRPGADETELGAHWGVGRLGERCGSECID